MSFQGPFERAQIVLQRALEASEACQPPEITEPDKAKVCRLCFCCC